MSVMSTKESDWNVVDRRKSKQKSIPKGRKTSHHKKSSNKRVNYSFYVDTKKVYFLPSGMIRDIDGLFKHGYTSRDFMKELVKICHPKNYNWSSCIVYVIHEASSRDKLELMEFILNAADDRTKIANSKCGPLEFTPIFKSAYKGSIRALKMLLCAGADLSIENKLGETVMQALEQGNVDTNKKSPEFKIFTDERYKECKSFLENWNPNRERPVRDEKFQAYVPPNMRNQDQEEEVKVFVEESLNDYSLKEFLNNFETTNQVREYFESKNSSDLINAIIESAEQGNDCFEKFTNCFDVIDKSNIKSALTNHDLIEYIKFDAPFTKKKLNIICEKLHIEKI